LEESDRGQYEAGSYENFCSSNISDFEWADTNSAEVWRIRQDQYSHKSSEICRRANLPSLVNGFFHHIAHGRGDWIGTELLSDNPGAAGGNRCTVLRCNING
jgi:hypothetical protein